MADWTIGVFLYLLFEQIIHFPFVHVLHATFENILVMNKIIVEVDQNHIQKSSMLMW